jgi:hypothetical protein
MMTLGGAHLGEKAKAISKRTGRFAQDQRIHSSIGRVSVRRWSGFSFTVLLVKGEPFNMGL